MKSIVRVKYVFSVLVILMSSTVCAQEQTQTYKQVKIKLANEKTIYTIGRLGIDIVCGSEHETHESLAHESLTLVLSEDEHQRLKAVGIESEVLIDNLSAYYAKQNMQALPKAISKLEQAKQRQNTKQAIAPYQQGGCEVSTYTVPSNFTLGSMGGFSTYTELLADLDQMANLYPNLIRIKTAVDTSTTEEGRPVYYVKLSDNPNVEENETKVLYTALHHAREPMSMMSLRYYMWYLLENYSIDPLVQAIVDNTELYFIPCVNPDGYLYNESINPEGGGLWRKNRRDNGNNTFGVDLNRNYDQFWGFDNSGSSPFTNNNTYRGPNAFSEQETKMLRDFAVEHDFVNVFNNHAYGNLLLHTWSYQPIPGPYEELLDEISEQMTWHNRFNYGNTFSCLNYFANGESSDWFHGEQTAKNMSLAWVPEIGKAEDGGFWPSPEYIQPQCEQYLDLALMMVASSGNYGTLNDLTSYQLTSESETLSFSVQHLGLSEGSFNVSVSSSSSYVTNIGMSSMNTPILDDAAFATTSTPITISSSTPAGTLISFDVTLNNGVSDIFSTTITKIFKPVVVFEDDFDNTDFWTTTDWDIITNEGYNSNTSITDSPTANSVTGTQFLELTQPLNLSLGASPVLEFYTKWDITQVFDFAQLQVSTNRINWTSLCGKYTKAGVRSLDFSPYTSSQPSGEGLYDGLQRGWVREQIDLSDYAGVNNLYLRFLIFNDPDNPHGDGICIDAIKILREPLGHCEDGIQNFDETGIDCGGIDCISCASCSDGVQNGDEIGIDCGGTYCIPCAVEQCVSFNFENTNILSFDAGQDKGTYTVLDNGATLLIEDNAWKAIKIDYNVTPNTILEFDFQSTLEGEIHEIELDTDLFVGGSARRYKLYGYQNVPLNANYTYTTSGTYEHFKIPIGQDFTGFFQYLVFTVDSDIYNDGNSYFRNVNIYEDINNNSECDGFTSDFVNVAPKMILGGLYNASTGKMRDQLRVGGLLPSTEPYTTLGYTYLGGGNENTQNNTFQVAGNDAIVDWVIVELRDKNDASNILSSRAALIQADGDIVDVDGVSDVIFLNILPDNYYVAIRHRNHLGTMTQSPIPLSGSDSINVAD